MNNTKGFEKYIKTKLYRQGFDKKVRAVFNRRYIYIFYTINGVLTEERIKADGILPNLANEAVEKALERMIIKCKEEFKLYANKHNIGKKQ